MACRREPRLCARERVSLDLGSAHPVLHVSLVRAARRSQDKPMTLRRRPLSGRRHQPLWSLGRGEGVWGVRLSWGVG